MCNRWFRFLFTDFYLDTQLFINEGTPVDVLLFFKFNELLWNKKIKKFPLMSSKESLMQWVGKVLRPLLNVHSLFRYSHLLKSKKFILFFLIVHPAPHLDKKTRNVEIFVNLLKKKN